MRPIQAFRVDPFCTSRCGLPSSTFTRATATGNCLFCDIVEPEGRVHSFVPTVVAPLQERFGWRHADACEGVGPRQRRCRLGGPRGGAGGHVPSESPVVGPVLPGSSHRAEQSQERDGRPLQSGADMRFSNCATASWGGAMGWAKTAAGNSGYTRGTVSQQYRRSVVSQR